MEIPGLYEVYFEIAKGQPELDIIEGSGYSVVEGPILQGSKNVYWVERVGR